MWWFASSITYLLKMHSIRRWNFFHFFYSKTSISCILGIYFFFSRECIRLMHDYFISILMNFRSKRHCGWDSPPQKPILLVRLKSPTLIRSSVEVSKTEEIIQQRQNRRRLLVECSLRVKDIKHTDSLIGENRRRSQACRWRYCRRRIGLVYFKYLYNELRSTIYHELNTVQRISCNINHNSKNFFVMIRHLSIFRSGLKSERWREINDVERQSIFSINIYWIFKFTE